MRKKIWRMSEGQFDREKPKLKFSVNKAEAAGRPGEDMTGEFTIISENQVPASGIILSSNPYVICLTQQFEGTKVRCAYRANSSSFAPGDRLEGYFTVLYNGGEESLPYELHVLERCPVSSMGEIRSLEDFTALAREQWSEAQQIFRSSEFAELISRQSDRIQLLYQGFRRGLPSAQNLEEFLIAAGCKRRVAFDVKEEQREYYDLRENQKETIVITKDNWGFISIQVASDSDFVTVEKEQVTSDFFLGNRMELSFYIHKERLHGGKNYARISFESGDIYREVTIVASRDGKNDRFLGMDHRYRGQVLTLMRLYEQFLLGQKTTGEWCDSTVLLLDQMSQELVLDSLLTEVRREERKNWYMLCKAYALIRNKKSQEALWLIQKLRREISDKKSVAWAFLLYLCTLIEQEEEYVRKLTREIEVISREHPGNFWMFCFLVSLKEEYRKSGSRKLKAIGRRVEEGENTPILYGEAYGLIRENPYLLGNLGSFHVKVLWWAAKHHGLTEDVALQLAGVLEGEKGYRERIFQILREAYAVCPRDEVLTALVRYLLKGHRFGEKYLPWYRLAIDREMSMTGLYEAFLSSIPDNSVEQMPLIVTKYFQYSSSVAYQKKGLLYGNIIANRVKAPEDYQKYERTIAAFAAEQMRLGHMDDNLAMIYQDVLQREKPTEEQAKAMAELLFMKKVICLCPGITRVFLYQSQYEMPFVAPVKNGCSYVPVISDTWQIFLEHEKGYLIADAEAYYVEELMYPKTLAPALQELAPGELPYILYAFGQRKKLTDFTSDDIHGLDRLLHAPEVRASYKRWLYPVILALFPEHEQEELVESYFVEEVDFSDLSAETFSRILEWLIQKGHFQRVYQLIQRFDGLVLSRHSLRMLCDAMIPAREYEGEDFLIALCGYLLDKNVVSAMTAGYLIRYYMGPFRLLLRLWRAARERKLPTHELEERMLVQTLYGELRETQIFDVFDSYVAGGGSRMMEEAFLTYYAHGYFRKGWDVPESIFSYIRRGYRQGEKWNDICRAACMQDLTDGKELTEEEFALLDELFQQATQKGIFFAFYRKADPRIQIKYHLYDKTFVEYRGEAGRKLEISWKRAGEEVREELPEMYEGIYVKPFVLFAAESVDYEIRDLREGNVIASGSLTCSDNGDETATGRYGRLNQMERSLASGTETALLEEIKSYQRLEQMTEQLFHLR